MPYIDIVADGEAPVSILFGIHGDELDTLIFAERLISLARARAFNRTCRLVLLSNPLACAAMSRVTTIDSVDLNRGFLKDREHPYSSALTKELERLVQDSACVITLHQFETDSPILAAYYDVGEDAVRASTWEILHRLDPEVVVWADPVSDPTYRDYVDTIEATLLARGIPTVMIEFSRTILSQRDRLVRFEQGLLEVLRRKVGNSPAPSAESYSSHLFYARHHVYPREYGIFEADPGLDILTSVEEGQILGSLITLPELTRRTIKSPVAGGILQIRAPSFVSPAQYVLVLGERSGRGTASRSIGAPGRPRFHLENNAK